MSVNDWGAALARAADGALREEAKGAGSIARFVAKHLAPEIGDATQRGAIAWRPESDECMKEVNAFFREAMSCDSVKGLSKEAALRVRNMQGFLNRAIKLYRACSILAAQHGESMDGEGRVPLAWFVPEGRETFTRKNAPTHVAFTGKARISLPLVPLEGSEDSVETYAFSVSESAVNALAFPKAAPVLSDDARSNDVTTLAGSVAQAASMLAKAEYVVSGDASDTFVSMLEAFIAASPANLALVAGMVDAKQREAAQAAA